MKDYYLSKAENDLPIIYTKEVIPNTKKHSCKKETV